MISPKVFYQILRSEGVNFFTGVPDSLLKEFCAYVDAVLPSSSHVIAANEGTAVGIASGYHLATGCLPMIYLQNSGLGNTINPLLSLADKEVYSLPLILLIGWRGEPGIKDEPQHIKQGRVTPSILETMELPYRIITTNAEESIASVKWACEEARKTSSPVVLLVQKGSFDSAEEKRPAKNEPSHILSREEAISIITRNLLNESTIVATTGMISRELYEQREALKQDRSRDFLTVGSMGHASQIALGISYAKPSRQVVCLDGDGAALMHLGGMATIGTSIKGNLLHIVLNNGAHDSVGGQPTVAQQISLTQIARSCGYSKIIGPIETISEIETSVKELSKQTGKRFLEVRVRKGARANLGRPKESPSENKSLFMSHLANN